MLRRAARKNESPSRRNCNEDPLGRRLTFLIIVFVALASRSAHPQSIGQNEKVRIDDGESQNRCSHDAGRTSQGTVGNFVDLDLQCSSAVWALHVLRVSELIAAGGLHRMGLVYKEAA